MKKLNLINLSIRAWTLVGLFSLAVNIPASATPQQLATNSKAQVVTTGSSLILASSPTGSNLTVDRVGRTVSGYAWSTDLGWVNFSAGLAVGSGGLIHGLTPSADGAAVLDFNSTPHNANVIINANNHLEGYAWSKDIGWIHFDGAGNAKSLTTNAPLDINQKPMRANVTIDDRTGQMAGYAWNRDLGWLDFTGVKVEPDGRVTGQATVKNSNNKLHFNSTPYNANVQVARNGQFSGYAWNDDLGWVAFNGVQTADNTFPIKQAPSKVLNLTATPITSYGQNKGAVRLNWDRPVSDGGSPIIGYSVEYCRSDMLGNCLPGTGFTPYNDVDPNDLSIEVHNLNNGQNDHHAFRVKARNAIGNGEVSDTVVSRAGYISLRLVDGQVAIAANPVGGSVFSSAQQNLRINSNLPAGLEVRLSTVAADNRLIGAGNQAIDATSGTANAPTDMALDGWGYRVNGGAFGQNTAVETNQPSSNFSWAKVPAKGGHDVIFTTLSPAQDVNIPVFYGFRISLNKPAGVYKTTVVYEAVGR